MYWIYNQHTLIKNQLGSRKLLTGSGEYERFTELTPSMFIHSSESDLILTVSVQTCHEKSHKLVVNKNYPRNNYLWATCDSSDPYRCSWHSLISEPSCTRRMFCCLDSDWSHPGKTLLQICWVNLVLGFKCILWLVYLYKILHPLPQNSNFEGLFLMKLILFTVLSQYLKNKSISQYWKILIYKIIILQRKQEIFANNRCIGWQDNIRRMQRIVCINLCHSFCSLVIRNDIDIQSVVTLSVFYQTSLVINKYKWLFGFE